jgi:hypothetical protein
MIKNPFKYGSVVSGIDFCGRSKNIHELTQFIESGQNVVLQGERRIGKTSLVYETVKRMNKRQFLLVDLMEVKTIEDVCTRTLRALVQLEQKSVFKTLAHLRPSLSVNSLTGDLSVSLGSTSDLNAESIADILKLISKNHARKPLVVFFDEFQDILKVDNNKAILAQLRGEIQYQGDVPYIFAGSIRNHMDDIFNHPDSPFFKSAMSLDVGPLSQQDFEAFLKEKFRAGKRQAEPNLIPEIFKMTNCVTGDVQQICEALWSVTDEGEVIDESQLSKALELIFSRESKSYEVILAGLTANYLNILKALSECGGNHVTSARFVSKAKVANGSTVTKALSYMQGKKLVFKHEGGWRFTNPFFGLWLLQA